MFARTTQVRSGTTKSFHNKPPCFSCTSTSTNGWRRFSVGVTPGHQPPWCRYYNLAWAGEAILRKAKGILSSEDSAANTRPRLS
ncbi:hypothetical protein EVAR_73914_1 [Eumeta japonica]|uniref:Uncharacterized protein n=1 Tax=Eumeta variegata TaxID=151549 RepID=A0A4C1TG36_EUMVA|nr:hypothetical protein EVAR_73914_1 [Eumeta japonica]